MTISKDSSAPLIAVIGATGTQGGSVIRALQDSTKPYRVQAVTRDASKPNKLPSDVEVVSGNADDIESLKKAFEGAEIIFAMTNTDYSDPNFRGKEARQGKAMMDAAKAVGVKTVLWAGLTGFSKLSNGKNTCVGFDEKAEVTEYGRSLNAFKLINVQPAGYASNHLYFPGFKPSKNEDGTYTLALALEKGAQYPVIDMDTDYGKFAVAALEDGTLDDVYAAGEVTTPQQITEIMSKVSGLEVSYARLSDEALVQGLGGPDSSYAQTLPGMFKGIDTHGYYGPVDVTESVKKLGLKPVTLEEYLTKNKAQLLQLWGA